MIDIPHPFLKRKTAHYNYIDIHWVSYRIRLMLDYGVELFIVVRGLLSTRSVYLARDIITGNVIGLVIAVIVIVYVIYVENLPRGLEYTVHGLLTHNTNAKVSEIRMCASYRKRCIYYSRTT